VTKVFDSHKLPRGTLKGEAAFDGLRNTATSALAGSVGDSQQSETALELSIPFTHSDTGERMNCVARSRLVFRLCAHNAPVIRLRQMQRATSSSPPPAAAAAAAAAATASVHSRHVIWGGGNILPQTYNSLNGCQIVCSKSFFRSGQ